MSARFLPQSMPLTLTLAGISVTLDKFINTEYPRITVQSLGAVEFSALGTPGTFGALHEPKYMWQFQAVCDKEQRYLIEALAYEFQTRRRALVECDILLWDTTAPIIERSRTRAIVPNTTETVINGGTHFAYHACFRCAITDGPKPTQNGRVDVLQMVLTETLKVAAA